MAGVTHAGGLVSFLYYKEGDYKAAAQQAEKFSHDPVAQVRKLAQNRPSAGALNSLCSAHHIFP